MRSGWFCSLLVALLIAGCGKPHAKPASAAAQPTDATPLQRPPEKLAAEHLPNPWRIHPRVISGGSPEGDAAFKELAELGVRTVISVDGARPDVATARKYGLRYVHLPHSYDGIPAVRAKQLAKAVRDLPGPIYIHCHHGKHRSPAAAAVACISAGLVPPNRAVAILQAAGTSENYRGLYQSAASAQALSAALLDHLPAEFPESAEVPPIADAMVEMERVHDHLRAFATANWQPLQKHPDLLPAHEALLLREHYTELARTDEAQRQPPGFRALLADSEARALELETLLNQWVKSGQPDSPPEAIGHALAAVTQGCTDCHTAYRDVPLAEKRR